MHARRASAVLSLLAFVLGAMLTVDSRTTSGDFGVPVVDLLAPLVVRIHDIQGATHLSPYEDDVVSRVPGVVTAVRSNGFYMQDDQPDDTQTREEHTRAADHGHILLAGVSGAKP